MIAPKAADAQPSGPLTGMRVFDATMFMAGPWSTMVLGMLGAEVLHIEQPDIDWSQLNAGAAPMIKGTASGYVAWNMNKRGVAIDFKNDHDLAFAYELIETCDVFVSNMRPLERLGLGYEKLKKINPSLVYCWATGYGSTGPRADERGNDARMQAVTGLWSTQGARGGAFEGYRHATQIDAVTGNLLADAALLGLYARKRTGLGQFIEVTMLDAGMTLQLPRVVEHFAGLEHQPQGSSAHATAPDRAFRCEDEQWLGVSITSERDWQRLCQAVERTELEADDRFATNAARVDHRDELEALLAEVFARMPRSYWELTLTRHDVPWGALSRWEELRYHAQVRDNDYLVEVDADPWDHVWTGGPPWRFSRTPPHLAGPPVPGIDTWVVKDELASRKARS